MCGRMTHELCWWHHTENLGRVGCGTGGSTQYFLRPKPLSMSVFFLTNRIIFLKKFNM